MAGFLPDDSTPPDPTTAEPTPGPAPTPAADRTIGDVIASLTTAQSDEATKQDAAARADAEYATAQQATRDASAELKAGIQVVQAAFTQDQDGNITVYLADASEAGYHAIRPVPAETPLQKG
jgi:hypothetical protein